MRYGLLVLCALLLLPGAGAAQREPASRAPRLALSAYSGVRVPYTTGVVTAVDEQGNPLFSVTEQRGGNPLLGVEARLRLAGRLSLVAGGAYSHGGGGDLFLERDPGFGDVPDLRLRYLRDTWFARAGVSARFQEPQPAAATRPRPATELTAAAGLIRQFDTSHPALNLGFEGGLPLGWAGAQLVLGLEDYLVFWDRDALEPVMAEIVQPLGDREVAGARLLYRTSNILLLRAGVSLRL